MIKNKMNIDELAKMSQQYARIYKETELIAFGPRTGVHVTPAGLQEVASVETWTWVDRWPDEQRPDDQWKASTQHNGVTFFALFSETEKQKAKRRRIRG